MRLMIGRCGEKDISHVVASEEQILNMLDHRDDSILGGYKYEWE